MERQASVGPRLAVTVAQIVAGFVLCFGSILAQVFLPAEIVPIPLLEAVWFGSAIVLFLTQETLRPLAVGITLGLVADIVMVAWAAARLSPSW